MSLQDEDEPAAQSNGKSGADECSKDGSDQEDRKRTREVSCGDSPDSDSMSGDLQLWSVEDENTDPASKRLKKSSSQPKKVNNEHWDGMFQRLVAYKEKHGHCLVPKRYAEDPKLGTWVETQRVQYKRLERAVDHESGQEAVTPNKRLNQERLEKLQSIGFAWSAKNVRKVKPPAPPVAKPKKPPGFEEAANKAVHRQRLNDAQWEDMYQRLKAYKEKYGDCLVPRKYEEDPKLATWVETQRVLWNRDYRQQSGMEANGKADDCDPSQMEGSFQDSFQMEAPETQLARMDVSIVDATQTQFISQVHEEPPEPQVTAMVASVSEDHQMGFTEKVDVGEHAEMQATLTETLDSSIDQHQNHETPHTATAASDIIAAPTALLDKSPDDWAGEMERAETLGATVEDAAEVVATMAEGGVDATDATKVAGADSAINIDMNDLVTTDNMIAFSADSNNAKAPMKRLTKERKEKLDSLGFVWSLRSKRIDEHWDEMFRRLVEYRDKHGDCLVPSRYDEDLKLGKWVETQRYEYTKLKRAEKAVEESAIRVEEEAAQGKGRTTNPRLTDERLRRLESIGFEWKVKNKMRRYYDKQWDHMFERLLKFRQENGHCMVPKRYPPDMKLGTWVHTQRIQYRKLIAGTSKTKSEAQEVSEEYMPKNDEEVSFRLTEDRRRRLEEIGFTWSARDSDSATETGKLARNSYDDQWDMMFNRLQAYKQKYGDCLVPKRHKEDQKLGTWVDTQRVQYKKMRKKLAEEGMAYEGPTVCEELEIQAPNKPLVGRLTDDRIRRLEGLGFVWSLRDDWQQHYKELIEYKKEHGHCNVPARYGQNRKLGVWVSAQRQQYKILNLKENANGRRTAPLTQERIDLLNEIGFTWTIRSRDSLGESWNQRLEELKVYKKMFGNCLVPSRYAPNPELGIWVGTQRTQYRLYMKSKESGAEITGSAGMNEERIRQLEELGFVWAIRGDSKREPEVAPGPELEANKKGPNQQATAASNPSPSAMDNRIHETVAAAVEMATGGDVFEVAAAATHDEGILNGAIEL